MPFSITAISGTYFDMDVNYNEKTYLILIGIFNPSGGWGLFTTGPSLFYPVILRISI